MAPFCRRCIVPAKSSINISQKENDMNRYLIETPHTAEECLDLIKVLTAQGYLWNFDWGCKAGRRNALI